MSRTDPVPLPAMPSVLIVEDDPTIGHHLHLGLRATATRRPGAAPSAPPKEFDLLSLHTLAPLSVWSNS